MTRKKSTVIGIVFLSIITVGFVSYAQEAGSPVSSSQSTQAQADATEDTPDTTPPLRIDVDLVLVTATVTDPYNRMVTDLQKENFKIFEDRIEQEIHYFSTEDVPMSLGIVFDISGSMKEKHSFARDAAVQFLRSGSPDDEYFIVQFNDRPSVAQDFTSDISQLQNHLIFTETKGMTALYDSVYLGLEKLKEGVHSKKALLLITDGEDNRSRYTFSNVKDFIREQDVQVYSIGIVSDWNSSIGMGRTGRALIEEISEITGGRAFFPDSVYELEDICTRIAIELKNQYVIGYESTNPAKDGKWRKINMDMEAPRGMPRLNVRYKEGYYAAAGDPGPK